MIIQTAAESHEEKKFFDFSIDGGNTIPVDLDGCEITQKSFSVLDRSFSFDFRVLKDTKNRT